jgi:hypothetical protein
MVKCELQNKLLHYPRVIEQLCIPLLYRTHLITFASENQLFSCISETVCGQEVHVSNRYNTIEEKLFAFNHYL